MAEKGSSHGEVNPTIKMPDRMGGHSQTTLTSISRKGKNDHPREKFPFGAWNIGCAGAHREIGDSVMIQDSAIRNLVSEYKDVLPEELPARQVFLQKDLLIIKLSYYRVLLPSIVLSTG